MWMFWRGILEVDILGEGGSAGTSYWCLQPYGPNVNGTEKEMPRNNMK